MPVLKLACEYLVLTAARAGEVRFATWGELDLESSTWTVPGERMKAGREHRVPLSPRAVEVLNEAQALRSRRGDLVFPSRGGRPLTERGFIQALARLGIDAMAHRFRASFRVWVQERTNFLRKVCEAALAHTLKDKAEAAYARSDLFEKRRELMAAWARYLNPAPADVVSLSTLAGGVATDRSPQYGAAWPASGSIPPAHRCPCTTFGRMAARRRPPPASLPPRRTLPAFAPERTAAHRPGASSRRPQAVRSPSLPSATIPPASTRRKRLLRVFIVRLLSW